MTVVAYQGTDRMDFDRFDLAEARIYNIGLHFGTRAAAESRIAYLREESPSSNFYCPIGVVYRNEHESDESTADTYCEVVASSIEVFEGEWFNAIGVCVALNNYKQNDRIHRSKLTEKRFAAVGGWSTRPIALENEVFTKHGRWRKSE